MGNLKSAPLFLTSALVAKLTGDRPAYGKGVVHVPLLPIALIDGPKRPEGAFPTNPKETDDA